MAEAWLSTERLCILPPTPADLDALHKLFSHPAVARYLGDGGPRGRAEVEAGLGRAVEHYRRFGFSLGPVYERATGRFVGRAGLVHLNYEYDADNPEIEVGYALRTECWGRGYATELGRGLLAWGFAHLDVARLVALARPDNAASRRVLEKCGMTLVGDYDYKGVASVRYEIGRRDWEALQAGT